MAQSWYPFYVGDYARKTSHLSMLEHGAYRLLLDHYYATGEPLPDDNVKLFRICRARTPSERQSVLSAVSEFFIKDGTLLRSEKCDRVLDKQLNYSKTQSANAKRRHSDGTATAVLHARVTKTRTKTKEEVSSSGFDEFWNLYPRKEGKGKAEVAYIKSLKETNYEALISGVKRYAEKCRGKDEDFIAHASTWLNGKRWTDEETKPKVKKYEWLKN